MVRQACAVGCLPAGSCWLEAATYAAVPAAGTGKGAARLISHPPTPAVHPVLRRVGVSAALAPCSLKCVGVDGRQLAAAGESGLLGLWSLASIQRALEVRRAG